MFFGVLTSVGAPFLILNRRADAGKMSKCNKTTKQVAESKKSAGMSNENRELFKRALSEALDAKISKIIEETKDIEIPPTADGAR